MLMYQVDLTSLAPAERLAAIDEIGRLAWDVYPQRTAAGITAVNVLWDRHEDFLTSPVFPKGCPCVKIGN